jgi:hypothetical protein
MAFARNLMLFREGGLSTFPCTANGEETEGEVAMMGMEDDSRRTEDGYKIPAGRI